MVIVSSLTTIYLVNSFDSYITFLYFFLLVFFTNSFIYLFNDYMDMEKDFHDDTKRERNVFLDESYSLLGKVLMIISVGLLFVGGTVGGVDIFIFSVILFVLSYNYSAGVRAKNKPGLDMVFHGSWAPFFILLGLQIIGKTWVFDDYFLIFGTFFLSLVGEFYQEIMDYDIDTLTGEKTTVVLLGLRTSKLLVRLIFFMLTIVFFIFFESWVLKILSLISFFYVLKQDFTNMGGMRKMSAIYFILLGIYYIF